MGDSTQRGYLLIADISGYTSYVAGTELEHSKDILSELLELMLRHLTGLMTLSKLEGDAVFVIAPDAKIPRGETVLELIESTYTAFRDRQESIRLRTTCDCSACSSLPMLDLKFIVHCGDYAMQSVSGIHELVGSDVNLVHRLLKNRVGQETGWKAYALFTESAMARINMPTAQFHEQVESYEHLGNAKTYSMDLRARYKELVENRRAMVTPEEADVTLVHEFAAPPPVVWGWLNDPQKRTQWMTGRLWSAGARPGGRTGAGARNHCAHGKENLVETILDWRPFEYVTTEQEVINMLLTETVRLEPMADGRGTRVYDLIQISVRLPRWIKRPVARFMTRNVGKYKTDDQYAKLARLIADANP